MRSGVVLRGVVVSLLVLLGVTGVACGGSGSSAGGDAVTGSAGTATKKYDSTGFTAVHAAQGASVVVQKGDSFAVSVTVNENLVQYLKVEVQGDTLQIGLDPSEEYRLADLSAEVTMPDLSGIEVTEAADVLAKGFRGDGDLTLKVSGAGQLSVEGMKAANATLDVSEASRLGGRLVLTGGLTMTASDAGEAIISGAGRTVGLTGTGASQVSLKDFAAQTATVNLSGGSNASVRAVKTVNVTLDEASALDYYGPAKLGNTDVNGASQINHMQ